MPKEQINYVQPLADLTAAELELIDAPYAMVSSVPEGQPVIKRDQELSVRWLREPSAKPGDHGWVQIALECDVSYLRFAADTPDAEDPDRSTVYSAVLDRSELNHLIRTLKRARDAAYGSDE